MYVCVSCMCICMCVWVFVAVFCRVVICRSDAASFVVLSLRSFASTVCTRMYMPRPPCTIVLLCSPGYGLNVLLFMRFSRSPPKNIFSWHAKSFCLNEVLILGEFLAKIGGKGRVCLFVGLRPALWSVARQLHENAFIIVANCCCFYVWTACAKAALKLQVFPSPSFLPLIFLAIFLFAFYFVYFQRPCHKFLVILLQIIYAHIEL